MSSWTTVRREPYSVIGIKRLRCIRCSDRAVFQWQICSDGNNWRPLCRGCDIALNQLVMDWMNHPYAEELMAAYIEKMGDQ